MPDANFYKACVPKWWSQRRPCFFPCGNRRDVIDTYWTLLAQHRSQAQSSYLNPDKLFALVDLDLQVDKIGEDYAFADTEAIFQHLYDQGVVNEAHAADHRIWVTGLIHKEAYYFLPALQGWFDDFPIPPMFRDQSLKLEAIYEAMSEALNNDPDLATNIDRACKRLNFCPEVACKTVPDLKTSWQQAYQQAADQAQKDRLIQGLLMVKKAKSYWQEIVPSPDSDWVESDEERFREQLLGHIGRFYAAQDQKSDYHVPCFFRALFQFQ